MEPARSRCMANHQSRWVVLVLLVVAVAAAGTYALRETSRDEARPARNAMINGLPSAGEHGAVGTSGSARGTQGNQANAGGTGGVIRELETITGLVDRRPLIGRKVDLHVPIAATANDQAFWVGEKDNRVLVVPRRDHRDSVTRQAGRVAGNGIARLEPGTMATITGSIQKLPIAEEMYSWGLTSEDKKDVAAAGVYLRADTVTVQ